MSSILNFDTFHILSTVDFLRVKFFMNLFAIWYWFHVKSFEKVNFDKFSHCAFRTEEPYVTPGPDLPDEMGRHCATKINETHVLITGGFNIDGKTYFVDTRGTVISKRIHIVEKTLWNQSKV